MVTRLKVDKAQLESSLREEEAKSGLLLKEVKESNEVRVHFITQGSFITGLYIGFSFLWCALIHRHSTRASGYQTMMLV